MKNISSLRVSFCSLFALGFVFLHSPSLRADFTPFMSENQEKKLGAQEHPKVLQQFGGVYTDRRVSDYIETISRRMTASSAKPQGEYKITLLDSPIVNAMALPGGYVYVTRGILAIANSEAEVAAVIGHEVGHVTARHSAKRQNTQIGAGVLGALLGAVIGSDVVSQLLNIGSQGLIASYSRGQERDADELGIASLNKAGYEPAGMANFLTAMQADQAVEQRIWGQANDPMPSFFSTHPATPQRIADARKMAGTSASKPRSADHTYLRALDGMVYGSSANEGYVRDRRFSHPKMLITFEVPQGFHLRNTPEAVIAAGPQGSAVKFDAGRAQNTNRIEEYLTREWAANVSLRNVERLTVNGMSAVTATTSQQGQDLRLVAIDAGGTIYRFLILTPPGLTQSLDKSVRAMIMSFRKLSSSQAAALKPLRIRIKQVARGQDVAFFARQMAFSDYREERFRALNGLAANETLALGRLVKIVSE